MRNLIINGSLVLTFGFFVFWSGIAMAESPPTWLAYTTSSGNTTPRPLPFLLSFAAAIVVLAGGIALADPMLFKLRTRSAISHRAEADAYHALRREWRIREKLEYAHTLGYASEKKYRKLHEFTSTIRSDLVDGVKKIDSTKVMHMQQLRNRYYQYIRDPIRKLDTESRKIDRFLKKNGVDPSSPEHSWNREKRDQEAQDAGNRNPKR